MSKVVTEVSTREGVDPLELDPPLQSAIDVEALESIFAPRLDDGRRSDIGVEFTYHGYRVTIELDDDVDLRIEEQSST